MINQAILNADDKEIIKEWDAKYKMWVTSIIPKYTKEQKRYLAQNTIDIIYKQ